MLLLGFLNFTTASSIKSFLLAVHIRGDNKALGVLFGFTGRLPNSDESPTPALNVCYNPFCLRGLHTVRDRQSGRLGRVTLRLSPFFTWLSPSIAKTPKTRRDRSPILLDSIPATAISNMYLLTY